MIPLHDDNPTRIFPLITVALIGVCILVFVVQVVSVGESERIYANYSAVPSKVLSPSLLQAGPGGFPASVTLITSMFLHGGWLHLLGNMLYLWIFGNNVEDAMGHVRFILFYTFCGVIAALSHAIPNATSDIPMVGASGAIAGVLGAYLVLYPRARVLVLIPLGFIIRTFYMPASLVLGLWFVIQLLGSAAVQSQGGGVAWGAHVGGFIAGVALVPLFRQRGVRLFNPSHRSRR